MTTVPGMKNQLMALYGIQTQCPWDGLLIATAIGIGLDPGVGRGLTTRLGDLLLTTMAAGCMAEADGAGAQGRSTRVRVTGLLSLGSSADFMLDSDLDSVLVVA
jgi:hypothetical protein